MLAPRKTLWSTPPSAVDHLVKWITLQPNDCVCDIGCGDGRVILQWAAQVQSQHQHNHDCPESSNNSNVSFLGIDIDEERIQTCQQSLKQARADGSIHESIQITFVCANALESSPEVLYRDATIFFLYLIPRGLKLMHPLLLEQKQRILDMGKEKEEESSNKKLQVVTYMAKLPGETPVDRALCQVAHQPGAAWPLYYYQL
jgi:SAM-dependent methyltransferase